MSAVDSIFANQTITTSGSFIFRAGDAAEATLVYRIAGPVSGTIQFNMAEVDPSDESTVIGVSKTTEIISAVTNGVVTLSLFNSTTVKVTWTVSGGASIQGVTASVFYKAYPGLAAVTFGASGGSSTLGRTINLSFNKADSALVANSWKRIVSYTVPALYTASLLKFTSYQTETAISRVVVEQSLGTHVNATNTFTDGTPYIAPQFSAQPQAEVTTAIATGAGNVTYTVGYTNEAGVAGRTGTITIPRGSVVGSRWDIVFQTGDLGIRSIQSVSGTPTVVGNINLLGLIQFSIHEDQSTTAQTETIFAPGILSVPEFSVIGIEYNGGTVSKTRLFDILLQLVQ